jgi:hypothetical protein
MALPKPGKLAARDHDLPDFPIYAGEKLFGSTMDTSCPWAIRAMSVATASTSETMWVERMTIRSPDCRKGLWLLLESLKGPRCDRVQINEHTNSAQLTGKLEQPSVTSYFTIYFLNAPPKAF